MFETKYLHSFYKNMAFRKEVHVDSKNWKSHYAYLFTVMATTIKLPLFDWPHIQENSLEFQFRKALVHQRS